MKRISTLFTLVIAVSFASAQSDTLLWMNFENADTALIVAGAPSGDDGPNWINLDFDGLADANARPQEWYLTLGFADADSSNIVLGSSSWLTGLLPGNRNYFISPKANIGSAGTPMLTWKSAPRQTPLFLDGYHVLVSTTDNLESSFTDTIFRASQFLDADFDSTGASQVPQFNWYVFSVGWVHGFDGMGIQYDGDSTRFIGELVENSVDMSAYVDQSIYIAFLHNSDDDNLIFIDDILLMGEDATSIEENELNASIKTFPNPATDVLNISYELTVASEVNIVITDMQGRTVAVQNMGDQIPGSYTATQDVSNMAAGAYTMTIEAMGNTFTKNFVVE